MTAAEERFELGPRRPLGQGVEAAGGKPPRRAHERAPGDARQRATDGDAAHAELGDARELVRAERKPDLPKLLATLQRVCLTGIASARVAAVVDRPV
ncbi:MAG: hypothetical protein LC659_09525, partial [Myxococcales bacterium]|nr:hypothetical protein [Myxococcales bacterium]